MDPEALARQLMATYVAELDLYVETIEGILEGLDDAPPDGDSPALAKLYRTLHNLKGDSWAVEERAMAELAHRVEDAISAVQKGHILYDARLSASLFGLVDTLRDVGAQLRAQQPLHAESLEALTEVFAAFVPDETDETDEPAPSPPAPEPEPEPEPEPNTNRAQPTPSPRTDADARPLDENLSIAASRVERVVAGSGELLTSCRGLDRHAADVARVRDDLTRWNHEWAHATEEIEAALARGGLGMPRSAMRAILRIGTMLQRRHIDLGAIGDALGADARTLERMSEELNEDVRRLRMRPFGEICAGLERAVLDLAAERGKQIHLAIEGREVELDRRALERLRHPLLHLVRNAVDHGIEPPAERQASGKAPDGQVRIAATVQGQQVQITVSDDGRGLDHAKLHAQAQARGVDPRSAPEELAFLPGVSTAPVVTGISGRGVGMDVVRRTAESLFGTARLASRAGVGTTVTVSVPMTLTTLAAILFDGGGQTFAIPAAAVQRLMMVSPDDIVQVRGRSSLRVGDRMLPLAPLTTTLGLGTARPEGSLAVMVVGDGSSSVALWVGRFLGERTVVVRSLGRRLAGVPSVIGATMLPAGGLALVLNVADLLRRAEGVREVVLPEVPTGPARRGRLLVVDDTATTRLLVVSVLTNAGYDVVAAVDGQDGWETLTQEGPFDGVVSDVHMPRLDGFGFTRRIRASPEVRHLPVLLLTGQETDEERREGLDAGASVYLLKSAFHSGVLLEALEMFL